MAENNITYISKITVGGITYDIKDAWVRKQVEALGNATHFLGVTTSAIKDGSTTNPIAITDKGDVTAQSGDIVMKNQADGKPTLEFIWNGTSWQEFGSTGSLKELAFHTASDLEVTVSGTTTEQTFTGTEATISHEVTYTNVAASGDYEKATGASFTYLGVTGETTGGAVTLSKTTVKVLDEAGSKTAGSAASLAYNGVTVTYLGSVKTAGKTPSINEGFFSQGSLPTLKGGKATVVNVTPGTDASLTGGSIATWTGASKASFTQGAKASFTQGSKAAWYATVANEVLSFSFTANGDDSFIPNGDDRFTANELGTFYGGSLPTLEGGTATVVTATPGSDVTFTAGTLPTLDSTKFDKGEMPTFTTGSSTSSVISEWTPNTPTVVTLPTFKDATLATDVESFTQPTVNTSTQSGSATISHTSTKVDVTGTASVTIADHKITPEGTISTASVTSTGSVAIKA